MTVKMSTKAARLHHDLIGAVRNLFSVVELAQIGTFDFQSEEGKKVAAQANDTRMLLEKEIERYVELVDKTEAKRE
jgi:hypothetical protein